MMSDERLAEIHQLIDSITEARVFVKDIKSDWQPPDGVEYSAPMLAACQDLLMEVARLRQELSQAYQLMDDAYIQR